MKRAARPAIILGTVLLAACASPAVPTPSPTSAFEGVATDTLRELPPLGRGPDTGVIGPNGGILFEPSSAEIEDAVAYRFNLGHCGLHSPVDVDGSFWDAIGGTTPTGGALDLENDGEMINATSGAIVVIGDEMRFRTDSGSVVAFERHPGAKEFRPCM